MFMYKYNLVNNANSYWVKIYRVFSRLYGTIYCLIWEMDSIRSFSQKVDFSFTNMCAKVYFIQFFKNHQVFAGYMYMIYQIKAGWEILK